MNADQVPTPAAAGAAQPQEEDLSPKVFVGNLAFATTEADLEAAFAVAGEVVKARVIRRFGRSQGYGFVSFTSEAAVAQAVTLLDKTEIQGRAVNVDAAKPRAEREPREPRAPRQKKAPAAAAAAAPLRLDADATDAPTDAAAAAKPIKKRTRKPKAAAAAAEGVVPTATDAAPAAAAVPRAPRPPRAPRQKVEGPASKTTLFVANLPFKVDSDSLAKIFADYNVASAKVVTLRNGRSKGFGFVELVSEEEQLKVLQDLEDSNLNVDGRDLSIRVAMSLEAKPDAEVPSVVVV
ncbi:hypothetical protein HDU98_012018 [Podochytrium sp. JEL0797]|nr:hypothetical protein HDU98_012018 [Podochytrium sp. JEL0797]